MRVQHITETQMLVELNIINLPDVERYADEIAKRCTFEAGQNWLRERVRRYLINNETSASRITSLTPNAPDWLTTRFNEKVPLYRFSPQPALKGRLDHVADWLNSMATVSSTPQKGTKEQALAREAADMLRKFTKLSLEQGFEHTDKWFERLNAISSEREADDDDHDNLKPVLETPQGMWFELMSQDCLSREGKLMGHCVGGGGYKVGPNGSVRIFSLRDANNQPHITIEVSRDDGLIQQIKGKENKAPIAKYVAPLLAFLNHTKLRVSGAGQHDLDRTGLVYDESSDSYTTVRAQSELLHDFGNGLVLTRQRAANHPLHMLWFKDVMQASYNVRPNGYTEKGGFVSDRIEHLELKSEKQEARTKAYEALTQYWNTLDPVPVVGGGNANFGIKSYLQAIPYFPSKRKYATVDEVSEPVGDFGERTVMTYVSPENEETFVFKKGEETRFTLYMRENTVVLAVGTTPADEEDTEAARQFLNTLPAKQNTESLLPLNLWWDGTEWITFDGERLGMTPLSGGYWGLAQAKSTMFSRRGVRIFNTDGKQVTTFRIPESLPVNNDVRTIIRANSDKFASMLNTVGLDGPDNNRLRQELRDIDLVFSKGQWSSMNDGKVVFEKGDHSIKQASNVSFAVYGPTGANLTIKKADKNLEVTMRDGIKPSEGQTALLMVDEWNRAKGDKALSIMWPDDLANFGMMTDDKDTLRTITEVYPTKTLKSYEDGSQWQDRAWARVDATFSPSKLPKPGNLILIGNNVVKARIYTNKKDGSLALIVVNQDGKIVKATTENIVPFISQIEDAITLTGMKANPSVLQKIGLMLSGGKLLPVSTNPRVEQYTKGEITYEDGHRWKRDGRAEARSHDWTLTIPNPEGKSGGEFIVLKITVDPASFEIEGIRFFGNAKKQPKLFRPYLDDFIDILEVSSSPE